MNCERVTLLLDDYIDGTLERALVPELERHLRDCTGCAREEREVRRVVSATGALPGSIEPTRDLWSGIDARLETRRPKLPVAQRTTFGWRRGLAAASLLLAMLAAGWLLRGYLDAPPLPDAPVRAAVHPPVDEPPVGEGRSDEPETALPAVGVPLTTRDGRGEIRQAEMAFVEVRQHLRAALDERRPALSAETVRTIDVNLKIMEAAIDEIRASLAEDPGNRELGKMLVAAQRREVEFLQSMTRHLSRL